MGREFTHKKFLNDMELGRLRKVLKQFDKTDHRNVLLIKVALATGARASELLMLTKDDILVGKLSIPGIKGSKFREIPIAKGLMAQIRRLPVGPDGRLFPISYPRLAQIWADYRPNRHKPFHCLRHTFAVNLFEKTRDIRLVQAALGHRNIQNTLIYSDYRYETKELQKLINGATLVRY